MVDYFCNKANFNGNVSHLKVVKSFILFLQISFPTFVLLPPQKNACTFPQKLSLILA